MAPHIAPLTGALKVLNDLAYKRDYDILDDPKATAQEKRAARERIDRSLGRGRRRRG